jgi:hypothetical protein
MVMPSKGNLKDDPNHPVVYQIRLKEHLDDRWADWFGGLSITLLEGSDTLLTGPVIDQAALHGVLKKVRDLGMPLLSVNPVEPGLSDVSEGKPLNSSILVERESRK